MTTRALVRHDHFDHDRARAGLRERVVAVTATVGGSAVAVTPEPLLAHAPDGSLLQSIRVDGPVTRVAGFATRAIPGGVRVLVPAVSAPTWVELSFPEFPGSSVDVLVKPQRQWEIHLVHHTHLDIGYTDPQGTVLREHLSYLDSCLDLVRATDDWPDEARFRWVVESLWSFDQWAAARPSARVDEFLAAVRAGRIELTAMPFNLHTEACSTDELHELLRLAVRTSRRHGVAIPAAMQTDVPGHVVGLVDALAQAGVRYLSVAHNWAGRSVPHLVGGQDLPRLFRWRSPAGSSVLVWVTDTPHGLAYMEGPMLGFDTSYETVEDLLPAYLTALAEHPYPFDGAMFGFAAADVPLHREPYPWDLLHLRVQGHFGDNAPPRLVIAETVRRWNETWAFPRLRLSRNEDFFVAASDRLGDRIPTFEGDWNDWWADGIGSGARPMQLVRRAQGALADAQTLGTIAGLAGAAADPLDAAPVYLAAALFDEHTWGAADPWTHGDDHTHSGDEQWHWKYARALDAHDGSAALRDTAVARLASVLPAARDALASFHVVNTMSWSRTDVVRAFLPESRVPLTTPVAVRDGRTGQNLPFEVRPQLNPKHRDAGRWLEVMVDDVPPLGSARVDVYAGTVAGTVAAAPVAVTGDPVLENDDLRVVVDLSRACIASIVDKSTGRELVNGDATFGFNAYVYDRYASAGGINHQSSRTEARSMELLGTRDLARPAALVSRGSGPAGQWLTYESVAPGVEWVRVTVRLRPGTRRLDIDNRLSKPATMAKESAYFAFPFLVADPTVRVEASGGVVGTGLASVPGGAAHMRAFRRWISLSGSAGGTVAWTSQDAPLVQIGDIAVPYAPFPPSTPGREEATVYSWAHNNLWDTNFPSRQGFEVTLRYSVGVPAGSEPGPVLGMRTAAATSRPLAAVLAPLLSTVDGVAQASWLSVDDERVRVVGLGTPEAGQVLVRLQSVAEEPLTVRVTPAWPVETARHATFLGEPTGPADVGVDGVVVVSLGTFGTAGVLLGISG
jgi:hypothetical protein